MSKKSSIEWTDATWNPVRGCSKVSPGCVNCYAWKFAERFRGVPGHPFEQGFDLRLVPEMIIEPLNWKEPRRIFVNSMSDLFHEDIPDDYIIQCAITMVKADWHQFQILTKRAERMQRLLEGKLAVAAACCHIFFGVSVENRQHGLPRLDILRKTQCQRKFISFEPLLESVGEPDLQGIDWVIVGGESGQKARPFETDWALEILASAEKHHVPFFMKQLGTHLCRLAGKKDLKGTDMADFPPALRMRQFPTEYEAGSGV